MRRTGHKPGHPITPIPERSIGAFPFHPMIQPTVSPVVIPANAVEVGRDWSGDEVWPVVISQEKLAEWPKEAADAFRSALADWTNAGWEVALAPYHHLLQWEECGRDNGGSADLMVWPYTEAKAM